MKHVPIRLVLAFAVVVGGFGGEEEGPSILAGRTEPLRLESNQEREEGRGFMLTVDPNGPNLIGMSYPSNS